MADGIDFLCPRAVQRGVSQYARRTPNTQPGHACLDEGVVAGRRSATPPARRQPPLSTDCSFRRSRGPTKLSAPARHPRTAGRAGRPHTAPTASGACSCAGARSCATARSCALPVPVPAPVAVPVLPPVVPVPDVPVPEDDAPPVLELPPAIVPVTSTRCPTYCFRFWSSPPTADRWTHWFDSADAVPVELAPVDPGPADPAPVDPAPAELVEPEPLVPVPRDAPLAIPPSRRPTPASG